MSNQEADVAGVAHRIDPMPDLTHNPVNSLIVKYYLVLELRAHGHHDWSLDRINSSVRSPSPIIQQEAVDQPDGQNDQGNHEQEAPHSLEYQRISCALEELTGQMRARGLTQQIADVAERTGMTEENLAQSLSQLSNEMFALEIKWSHVATYFAFCGELAHQFVSSGRPHLVAQLATAMISFIESRLVQWIAQHGGWVSLFILPF